MENSIDRRKVGPAQIGHPAIRPDSMRADLVEFAELYEQRPISDNRGGMSSTHLFLLWHVLRTLRPKVVIESGVLRGQGTWLIEQARPDATIFCIDPNWSRLVYRSERAAYLDRDFSECDWSHISGKDTLVVFDDHVNAISRLQHMQSAGIRHAMFDDNYPPGQGDCYSLKTALAGLGFRYPRSWRYYAGKLLGKHREADVPAELEHARFISDAVEVYQELPPIVLPEKTRWGTAWPPTPSALLGEGAPPALTVFADEARWYTWMAYVRLRERPATMPLAA